MTTSAPLLWLWAFRSHEARRRTPRRRSDRRSRSRREIRNARLARAVLDDNKVIATAKEKIAGEGAALAEDERVRAIAQNHVSHDAPVIDHRLLPGATQNRVICPLDEAEILQSRGRTCIGQAVALQDVQLDGGRVGVFALDDAGTSILHKRPVAGSRATPAARNRPSGPSNSPPSVVIRPLFVR